MHSKIRNKLPQNAAYTGSREVLSIRMLYRTQWAGNKNGGTVGAPQTASFTIHSPLKNEHFALGFFYTNDRLGKEHKNQFNVTYAYRVALGKKVKSLSLDNKSLPSLINSAFNFCESINKS